MNEKNLSKISKKCVTTLVKKDTEVGKQYVKTVGARNYTQI